jgi:hypothetical protein
MNEQDNEYLYKLYKGFAMMGFLMNGDYTIEEIPSLSDKLAKAMTQEIPESGIVAVKRSSTKRRSNETK